MSKGLPRSLARGDALRQELIKTTIPVRDLVISVSATAAAIGFGSGVISGLPEGNILVLGAVGYFSFAGSGSDANLADTWSGDFAVGSAPTADADLGDASDIDLLPSTAIGAATAEVIGRTRSTNATAVVLDNTDGSLEANLNLLIDAADITDDQSVNITVNGELTLAYIVMLDD